MTRLLVLADDMTGALDSGVQCSKQGIQTAVLTSPDAELSPYMAYEALVIHTDTRHLRAQDAYARIFRLTQAARCAGIPWRYKKTDSLLRGNIGGELSAALDAAGCSRLYFAPAYPKNGRTTEDGHHYVWGAPLQDMPADPLNPIQTNAVADIIRQQAPLASIITAPCGHADCGDGIIVLDAQTEGDLEAIADFIWEADGAGAAAGCAGLLYWLVKKGPFSPAAPPPVTIGKGGILLVSGSMHPATLAQLAHAQEAGYATYSFTPDQMEHPHAEAHGKIMAQLIKNNAVIFETGSTARRESGGTVALSDAEQAASAMARFTANILECIRPAALIVFGGDTLGGVLQALGAAAVVPQAELFPGVPLTLASYPGGSIPLVSKAGGFGDEDIIPALLEKLRNLQKE